MFWLLYDEDMEHGDITSEAVIPKEMEVRACVIAREQCVLAGAEYVAKNLRALEMKVDTLKDGTEVNDGTVVMEIQGNARRILSVERTLLNILGRMSGIATETRRIVEKVRRINPRIRIAATRKTLWSYLDKIAVKTGGGDTHRWNLGDMVMIKDNHLALVSLQQAIERAKRVSFTKKIEVEVECEEDAVKAAELGVDIILLDNLSPKEVCTLVKKLRKYPVLIEVSGGITPENVEDYARCDVDIISMGYLTHSARSVNFSLEIEKEK